MAGLMDFLQAASNAAASNVSGPIDLLGWALNKAGVPVGEPVGGSAWMKKKGLMRDVPQSAASLAGETVGLLSPIAAAQYAPQIASGLLKAQEAAKPAIANMAENYLIKTGQAPAIFIGEKAKTWNAQAAKKAQEMERAGIDAQTIWKETGTFKGVDGAWRQEIDDSGALFNATQENGVWRQDPLTRGMGDLNLGPTVGGKYSLLNHPTLDAAYGKELPRNTYIKNRGTMLGDGLQGAYDDKFSQVTLYAPATAENAKSTTLHEVQHAIQQREGWARGGNPQSMAEGMYGAPETAAWEKRYKELGSLLNQMDGRTPEFQALMKERTKLAQEIDLAARANAYRHLAGEAEARAVQARMNMTPAERAASFPFSSYDVPVENLIVRKDAAGPQLATVWHGSPHKFDKLDSSKIGTGEGAQAYGHGLYLAESPVTADTYRVNLSYDPEKMRVGGKQINSVYSSIENSAARMPPKQAAGEYEKLELLERLMQNDQLHEVRAAAANMSPATQQWFAKQVEPAFETYGNLYKVDLPDSAIARMLDWDKPLSQQAKEVRLMAKDLGISEAEVGAKFYQALANTARDGAIARGQNAATTLGASQAAASNDLRAMGIPGIRYLDGGSRSAGQGTSNYVIFPGEEGLLTILERNGIPLK